jgi:hypothetical protein
MAPCKNSQRIMKKHLYPRTPLQASTLLGICHSIILIAVFAPYLSRGQDALPPNASSDFRSRAHGPFPNVELPAQVIAPDGQLTLFADYSNSTKDGVPLYLINRTNRPITVPAEYDELYIKLHGKSADGYWQRAQAALFGSCGTRNPPSQVSPGQHLRTFGYQPSGGTMGETRYQFVHAMEDVISNTGSGRWSEDDMRASNSDQLAASSQPVAEWLGTQTDGNDPPDPLKQWQSIWNAIAWLDLISRWKTDGFFRYQVGMVKEAIRSQPASDPKESETALAVITEIGARQSAPDTPSEVLRQACIKSIKSLAGANAETGLPLKRALIAWQVFPWLIDLETTEKRLVPAEWKDVFALVEARFAVAEPAEKEAMFGVFNSRKLVSEHVKTSFLVSNVASDSPTISALCIAFLADRQAYRELAEIGLEADMDLKMRILAEFSVIPGDGIGPRPFREGVFDPTQQKFRESCFQSDPWRSYYEMNRYLGLGFHDRTDLDPWLFEKLRDAFKRLIVAAQKGPYPVTGMDQQWGLNYYVRTLPVNMQHDTLDLLRKAAGLKRMALEDEPEANSRARLELFKAAGRELGIDEAFR